MGCGVLPLPILEKTGREKVKNSFVGNGSKRVRFNRWCESYPHTRQEMLVCFCLCLLVASG
jgi:hypothetical protein